MNPWNGVDINHQYMEYHSVSSQVAQEAALSERAYSKVTWFCIMIKSQLHPLYS